MNCIFLSAELLFRDVFYGRWPTGALTLPALSCSCSEAQRRRPCGSHTRQGRGDGRGARCGPSGPWAPAEDDMGVASAPTGGPHRTGDVGAEGFSMAACLERMGSGTVARRGFSRWEPRALPERRPVSGRPARTWVCRGSAGAGLCARERGPAGRAVPGVESPGGPHKDPAREQGCRRGRWAALPERAGRAPCAPSWQRCPCPGETPLLGRGRAVGAPRA